MSHHNTVYKNKEFRKYFSRNELDNMTLINIKGLSGKRRGLKKHSDGTITVFGSDFIAKVYINN